MRIKERPGDFRVTELLDATTVARGQHALYRLTKEKRNTLDVVAEAAEIYGLRRRDVRYLGLKDYEAKAVQYISVPQGPPRNLNLRSATLRYLGRLNAPLAKEQLLGNGFRIVLRRLAAHEPEPIAAALQTLARTGLPNYFDEQRFGSVRRQHDFPYRAILDDKPEEALRLLYATPSGHDTPGRRRRARRMAQRWGRWGLCRRGAATPHERSVFGHLCGRPTDFAGALGRLDRPFLLLLAFSYQSYIWNEALSRNIRELVHPDVLMVPYRLGRLAFPGSEGSSRLVALKDSPYPLPGANAPSEPMDPALVRVLANENITLDELSRPTIKSVQLRWGDRPALVRPAEAQSLSPQKDPLHNGWMAMEISFTLPRGAYATTVLKALQSISGVREEPRRGQRPDRR